MYGQAIAQVDSEREGIHVLWMGPSPWLFSPEGFEVLRRAAVDAEKNDQQLLCDTLDRAQLAALRERRIGRRRFATVDLHPATWRAPAPASSTPDRKKVPAERLRLALDAPTSFVSCTVDARAAFAIGLRDGKVVAHAGPESSGGLVRLELEAAGLDTVHLLTVELDGLRWCVRDEAAEERLAGDAGWASAMRIGRLQLPMAELDPALRGPGDELSAGRARLLSGERLEPEDLANALAPLRLFAATRFPRPVDQALWLKPPDGDRPEELGALDPLRLLWLDPRWRRVLGLGLFDAKDLVPGLRYEYRITGSFPRADLSERVHGFHRVPTATLLPASFSIGDLLFQLAEPAPITAWPIAEGGRGALGRRGLRLGSRAPGGWVGLPFLGGWEVVLDWPTPVTALTLEVAPSARLEVAAAARAGDPPVGHAATTYRDVGPSAERMVLSFTAPVTHLRLKGEALLFAVRLGDGARDLVRRPVVTAPVRFADAPLPGAPDQVVPLNLDRPLALAPGLDPPAEVPPRLPFGFEVTWRPALRGRLPAWLFEECDVSAPIDSVAYRVEHRRLALGGPAGEPWSPLGPGSERTMGAREPLAREVAPGPNADLAALYPESRPPPARPRHVDPARA